MICSRRLLAVPTLATLGWALTTAGPIAAKTITYTPQQVYYTYCFSHPPVARIASGDTVVTKTRDASNDLIQPTDKTTGKLDLSRANPQTGPFFVEGAEPGDTLKVRIDKITLNRNWGWGGAMPYFGALAPEYKTMMITSPVQDMLYVWKLDARRQVAVLRLLSICQMNSLSGTGGVTIAVLYSGASSPKPGIDAPQPQSRLGSMLSI